MYWQKQKDAFWRDVTGLGSSGMYFLLIILFFVLGQTRIGLQLIVGYGITYVISGIIKLTYFKDRPKKQNYNDGLEKIDASAFPSVHAARATFTALILSKIFQPTQWFVFGLTLLVCYSRIIVNKHDWKDVLGGIVLGAVAFWAITNLP